MEETECWPACDARTSCGHLKEFESSGSVQAEELENSMTSARVENYKHSSF